MAAPEEGGDAPAEKKSVGVQTYARVRCFFPDRERVERAVLTKNAKETGGKGILTTLASPEDSVRPMTTQFTDVLGEKDGNEHCFGVICQPLIETTLQGFKALLIAYGQSGSGKTFSLIGAKGPGQLGLLPRTIQAFLESPQVILLQMKGFEAYSTSLKKIPLYDLFNEVNVFNFAPFVPPSDDKATNKAAEYQWVQKKSKASQSIWKTKAGRTGINTMDEGEIKNIETVDDGFRLVDEAHDASHFAKTGKNPESSRGHTVYILYIKMKNPKGEDYSPVSTQFVVVDLAGSEGGSTLEALPDGPEKTCRFLEGGVINYGLTSLKDMFKEMRTKGKLKQSQGNGLRKLLYPFVTSNTMMSICFTLSPSMQNIMPTRATMKFAQDACKLKMKPVADTGGKNWQKLYEKLKVTLTEKLELIDKLQETIDGGIEHASGGGSGVDNSLFGEILGHILQDKQDRVSAMFREYDLEHFLDGSILRSVKSQIIAKKDEYYQRLKGVYQKHDPSKIDDIYDLLDEYEKKGIGYHDFYEFESHKYGEVAHRENRSNYDSASASIALTQKREQASGKTEEWKANAEMLRAQHQAGDTMSDIENMEQMMTLGTILEEDEDGHHHGHHDLYALANSEPIEIEHAHVQFHELDHSEPPPEWQGVSDDLKDEIHDKMQDEKYVFHGQMTRLFEQFLEKALGLDEATVEHLFGWLIEIENDKHHGHQVTAFSQDYHGQAELTTEQMEDLPKILELQHRVHELENDKRVEKSLKLWTQMRVRIRDRKLREKEDALNAMRSEIDLIHRKDHQVLENIAHALEDGHLAGGGDVDTKLNSIMSELRQISTYGVPGGNADPELERKYTDALNQIKIQEETISEFEGLKDKIANPEAKELMAHFGEVQAKVGKKNLEILELQGRLEEVRHVMRHQGEMVDGLKQQIFIILHFPKQVKVEGRSGFNDNMNGDFMIGGHLHDGRVFYHSTNSNWVIRWYQPKKLWIMDHRGLNDDDTGSACVDDDVQHPLLIQKTWCVYDGVKFSFDPEVTITGDMQSGKRIPGN